MQKAHSGVSPAEVRRVRGRDQAADRLRSSVGGLTYALAHHFDGWTLFNSPANAVLTVVFLLLQYFSPGMIKTFLTLRTGNIWVHVWAYHAFVPHVIFDTPLKAKIFHIS